MRIESYDSELPPDIGALYSSFEAEFEYPLGPGSSFRISHDAGAHRFYGAMGAATCVLALDDEGVCGSGAAAIRRLRLPGGDERAAAYFGDLRISSRARGTACLFRIVSQLESWSRKRATMGLAIAMDGTARTPVDYTGRAGIPAFGVVGRFSVWLLGTTLASEPSPGAGPVPRQVAEKTFRDLTSKRTAFVCGEPARRSISGSEWIQTDTGMACGCIEDTRRAKRLIASNGQEILGAHLSSFAFEDPQDGCRLLRNALRRASELGFDHLFVAVPIEYGDRLRSGLSGVERVEAPATLYGVGAAPAGDWNINTSEI